MLNLNSNDNNLQELWETFVKLNDIFTQEDYINILSSYYGYITAKALCDPNQKPPCYQYLPCKYCQFNFCCTKKSLALYHNIGSYHGRELKDACRIFSNGQFGE
jgi:hypothetical protein